VARAVLEHVAGRVPVIVTTSHFSARVTAERSRAAQRMGAAMVMVMPPFFGATLTVAGPAVLDFFDTVASAIDIPIMVQDAPLSSTPLPVDLLVELVKRVPAVRYAKIEVPFAADKLAALGAAVGAVVGAPLAAGLPLAPGLTLGPSVTIGVGVGLGVKAPPRPNAMP
jgi:4-hydroxy-tetrahydrodipicolinate synthase